MTLLKKPLSPQQPGEKRFSTLVEKKCGRTSASGGWIQRKVMVWERNESRQTTGRPFFPRLNAGDSGLDFGKPLASLMGQLHVWRTFPDSVTRWVWNWCSSWHIVPTSIQETFRLISFPKLKIPTSWDLELPLPFFAGQPWTRSIDCPGAASG